jgi:hypothetical protein
VLAGIGVLLASGPLLVAAFSLPDAHVGPGANTERLAVYFLIEGVTLTAAAGVNDALKRSAASQAGDSARRRAQRARRFSTVVWWLALAIELLLPVAMFFGLALSIGVAG